MNTYLGCSDRKLFQQRLDKCSAEDRATLIARNARFELHEVPNWFRLRIMAKNREHGWELATPAGIGSYVLHEFNRLFSQDINMSSQLDHWGRHWNAEGFPEFVSQPYGGIERARGYGKKVAELLDLDWDADLLAPWHTGCYWIAWRPKAGQDVQWKRRSKLPAMT